MKNPLPHEYNAIAEAAYAKYRAICPTNPPWSGVSQTAKIAWHDRVASTVKMQKYATLPNLEENCTLQAIREHGEPIAPAVKEPLKAAPSQPASETKTDKPIKKGK